MSEYEPGTVAVATVRGVPHRVLRSRDDAWLTVDGTLYDDQVTDIRPIMVLDPEDREQCKAVFDAQWRAVDIIRDQQGGGGGVDLVDALQMGLGLLLNPSPPKPAEPKGLGAVVETPGGLYVRSDVETCNPWRGPNGIPFEWDDLDGPVRVLSEGVRDV